MLLKSVGTASCKANDTFFLKKKIETVYSGSIRTAVECLFFLKKNADLLQRLFYNRCKRFSFYRGYKRPIVKT